jgi:hypothetical protein
VRTGRVGRSEPAGCRQAERALGVVKAFSIATPSGLAMRLDVDAAPGVADSGDPEQDLSELLCEIGEVARQTNAGALFLIDEMHNLDAGSLASRFEAVREIVGDSLARSFFSTRMQLATDAEQRNLIAMAHAGEAPYRSAEVARVSGVKDQRGASMHRDALIRKGLVYSWRRGQLDYTVPLFAEYLRSTCGIPTGSRGPRRGVSGALLAQVRRQPVRPRPSC